MLTYTDLSEAFKRPNQVRILDLRNQGLNEVPAEVFQFRNLTQLHLYNNHIDVIPPEIEQLTNLTFIELGNNPIEVIPPEVGQLTNLTELRLYNNQIEVIPPEIGQLTNLTRLGLGGNLIRKIPSEIGQLTNLTQLNLVANQIEFIPPEIGQLTNLTILYLSHNEIRFISPEVGQLTSLISLELGNNQIQEIPAEINQLNYLVELYLYNNQIEVIPPEIIQLTSLITLSLTGNHIRVVPSEVSQLTNLEFLDFESNFIKVLPVGIESLVNLKSLNLNNNKLTDLPVEINRLTKLWFLHLGQNRFRKLPEAVTQLSNLQVLHFEKNQIRSLPTTIKNLIRLEELWLGRNFLRRLPIELGQLTSLTKLHLGRNLIHHVPSELGNLKKLVSLNLSYNRLSRIPREILDLQQLETLDLEQNVVSQLEGNVRRKTVTNFDQLLTYQELQQKLVTEQQDRKLAETTNQIKDQFLSQMSHELRTPIHGVMGSINLIDKHKLDGQQLQHLQRAKTSGQHLLNMVNEILQFTELEKGQITYQQLPFNLIETCQQVLEIVLPLSQQKNLDLNLNYQSTFPVGWVGDQHKIRQVLINLLGNAVKFTFQGEISLGLQQTSKGVRIEVADTGIGIEEDQIKPIFEPFTQGSSGINRRFGGTGLGLTISQQFVVGMDGDIGVESHTGQGSTFWVELPLPTVNLKPETEAKDPELEDYSGKTVLVVDDEMINREIIRTYLQYWGFEVHQADDGQDCLDQFEIGKYDLIIMDLQMPELDGFETTEQIRQWERESNHQCTPILGLSASVIGDVWSKCESVGMNEYLSKPFETNELKQKVRQLLTD